MSLEADAPHRRIRSFVRREGRMTDGQRVALESLWPTYGLDAPAQPLAPATLFGREAPVVFEIGFGNGDHLLSRALNEPQHDFIGVEVHRPGCGRVMMLAEKQGSTNLRVACHDAVEVLRDWLVPGSLAEVVIYFPDPWHKKRHHKRRLIQPPFVRQLAEHLAPGGYLHCATDWQPYAEQMLEVLSAEPLLANTADGYAPQPEYRPLTKFENRGMRLGHGVWDLVFARR